MTLYLYKIGTAVPVLTIENAVSYTDKEVRTKDGTIHGPLAEDCELSSLPDCSEALRAGWRAEHPGTERRVEELEALVAELLFGGGLAEGGEAE